LLYLYVRNRDPNAFKSQNATDVGSGPLLSKLFDLNRIERNENIIITVEQKQIQDEKIKAPTARQDLLKTTAKKLSNYRQ